MRSIIVISFLILSAWSFSQEIPPREYKVQLLDPAINSSSEELMPLQKNNSEHLFFTRAFHPKNIGGVEAGHDIWLTHSLDSTLQNHYYNFKWLNDVENNAVIGIHSSDDTLFLMGSYFNVKRAKRGIAYSYREDSIWVTPKRINIEKFFPKEGYYGFYMHPSGKVLLISMVEENAEGFNEDLYVSIFNPETNGFDVPLSLGPTINTDSFEISPFLSHDLQTLYFSSDRPEGYGRADIYRSSRLDDSWTAWSEPELLPVPINSSGFEAYFSIGTTGDAFFSSDRNDDNSDLYKVSGFILSKEDSTLLAKQQEAWMDSLRRAEEELIKQQELAEEKQLPITAADSLRWIAENIDSTSLVRVHYFYNRWNLSKAKQIRKVEDFVQNVDSSDYILIMGNADTIGSELNNRVVAERRAKKVAEDLMENGINRNRIIIQNNGSTQPVDTNSTPKGRAENRRSDLYIIEWRD